MGWSSVFCRYFFDGLNIFPLVILFIGGFITFSLIWFFRFVHLFFFCIGEFLLLRVC